MSIFKTYHFWPRKISLFLSFFALMLASYLIFTESVGQDAFLSNESVKKMHAINMEHEIFVESLVKGNKKLDANLFKANSLREMNVLNENQGLIASIEDSTEFLILKPAKALNSDSLSALADIYEESIPEFEHVEIDQDILLEGTPHYFVLPDASVDLSTEIEEENVLPVRIAVIDSGIDASHEVFADTEIAEGWNSIDKNTFVFDDVGHGTHIAGIISQEAENIIITPYKIVNAKGGRLSNVLDSMHRAIYEKPHIINASFGLLSPSYSLETMVNKAYEEGIIIVCASGNNNSSAGFYPATYKNTIAVASLKTNGETMEKSNYGDWVDVASLGQMVLSALPNGEYGYKSGTSQSSAKVSARVAEIIRDDFNFEFDFESIKFALIQNRSIIESGKLTGVPIVD